MAKQKLKVNLSEICKMQPKQIKELLYAFKTHPYWTKRISDKDIEWEYSWTHGEFSSYEEYLEKKNSGEIIDRVLLTAKKGPIKINLILKKPDIPKMILDHPEGINPEQFKILYDKYYNLNFEPQEKLPGFPV